MKKIIALTLALLMVGAALVACGGSQTTTADATKDSAPTAAKGSDLEAVQAKGKLIVGITDFEPMDYQDESGKWIGFDADMAAAFAESLGDDFWGF